MPTIRTRRGLLAGAGATALASLSGCFLVERDEREAFERTYDVGDVDAIALEGDVGDVDVQATERADVHVAGEKLAASEDAIDALELRETRGGATLELTTAVEGEPWPVGFWRTPQLSLTVEVPRSLQVERAAVDTGDVTVRDALGPLDAEADTGDVSLSGTRREVSAETDTGDVSVDGGEVRRLVTDTGDVDATIRSLAAPASVETDTGDATVALARDLDVTVSVSVDTGEISVGSDAFASVRVGDESGEVVLGDGSAELSVVTDTGDVRLSVVE